MNFLALLLESPTQKVQLNPQSGVLDASVEQGRKDKERDHKDLLLEAAGFMWNR